MNIIRVGESGEDKALGLASDVLVKGGVVVIPTDTVYGLAADAMNEKAVAKVFRIKNRDEKKPLPVLVSDFDMMNKVALVSQENRDHIAGFETVTAILPARGWMPLNLRSRGLTIGARIPRDSFALRLITAFGGPLVGTSANRSGSPSHARVDDIIKDLKGIRTKPDLIIDMGELEERDPSMIVDFTVSPPAVLRAGSVAPHELVSLLRNSQDGGRAIV